MRRLTILKLLLMSLASAAVLSALYFFTLRLINENASQTHRQELALTIAGEIEKSIGKSNDPKAAIEEYARNHTNGRGDLRLPLWIVNDSGDILASTHASPLPSSWDDVHKPESPHEVVIQYRFLSLSPDLICVHLDLPTPNYLVLQLMSRRNANIVWGTPFVLIFITVAVAIFLSLSLTFFYLQSKSKEAKQILSRLAKGDLKARFKIQRFDEIGNLMLDFNQMADEIEKLILRVQTAEQSRRNMLQELGHDLRTPLTSLRTSFETLESHFEMMPEADRKEFFTLIDGEMDYVVHLLEDLFFIAELDEPKYKNSIEKVDLLELLTAEIRARQSNYSSGLQFLLTGSEKDATILGDAHLINRLFKNALDNAARFSKNKVQIHLQRKDSTIEVSIQDDGTGLSKEAIADFGSRRRHRIEKISEAKNVSHFSLGLGSVIMRTIAEIHHGRVDIQNEMSGNEILGAKLKIIFPKP
jgi:signal transduction histidine kinase